MKRWLYLLILLLCFCATARSQQTIVTGTVVDPHGLPYQAGYGQASIQCTGNAQPYLNNSPLTRTIPIPVLSGSGSFTMSLWSTNGLVDANNNPVACQWRMVFNDHCAVANFSVLVTGVNGAGPVDLSGQINAAAVPLSAACTPNGGQNMDNIPQGIIYQKYPSNAGIPLVNNGNFEISTNTNPVPGWVPNPNATLLYDAATPYEGTQSLKMVANTAGGGAQASAGSFIDVNPGDIFFIQGAAKGDGIVSASVQIQFTDKTYTIIGSPCAGTTASPTFVLVNAVCVAPANSVFAFVTLESLPAGTAGTTEFDAIYAYKTQMPALNNAFYVGGPNSLSWGGGDIGAQINKAYAALPAQGGTVHVVPQSNGVCAPFSTPIVATVVGKYLLLEGTGSDAQSDPASPPSVSGGTCLNWTPTTGTAITIDYTPTLGGGYAQNHGIRNLTLTNNQCVTLAGCGSSAIGFQLGGTTSGVQNSSWNNFRVSGFSTGISVSSAGSTSWGTVFSSCGISYNSIGVVLGGGIENIGFDNCKIAVNGTGINLVGASTDFNVVGGSIDSNGTCGVVSAGGDMFFTDVHFENLGQNGACYVNGGLTVHIHGGLALDDCTSSGACGGVTPSYWFTAPVLTADGMDVYSAGRIPGLVFLPTSAGTISITDLSGIPEGNIVPAINGNTVYIRNGGIGSPATIEAVFFIADGGPSMTIGAVALSGWGSGAAVTLPEGGSQKFSFAITAGTSPSLNPTATVTYPHVWPVPPLMQCKFIGGSGAPAFISGEGNTISTTTLGPLIYNGTPSSGLSYQISCQGM